MHSTKGFSSGFGRKNLSQRSASSDFSGSQALADRRPETARQFAVSSRLQNASRTVQQKNRLDGLFPKTLQAKMGDDEELTQKKALQRAKSGDDDDLVRQRKAAPGSSGGMPAHVQNKMEKTFNSDFSGVRIHPNSPKASSLGALAYTQGRDIHFAQGKFDPGSKPGQELLGHELTHVVQQNAGRVSPTVEVGGVPVNDDPGLEREADQMGRKAAG